MLDDPRVARPLAESLGLIRPRPGPEDLPRATTDAPRYEPDPDHVDPPYDA